jgi:hypothetical protein
MKRFEWIRFLAVLSLGSTALAHDESSSKADGSDALEPLITDRPDFTESTDAVQTGHVQLEGGYTFSLDRERRERERAHTLPEALLRIGLFHDFELRLGWEGYSFTDGQFENRTRAGRRVNREDWSQGANDVTVGVKYKFFEQHGLHPHVGMIAQLSAPSGSAELTSGDVDPEVKWLWAYDLSEKWGLAGNLNIGVPSDEKGRFVQASASISAAYSWTERFGSYLEYYGFYPNARDADCAHTLNGGVTFLVHNDFQIDLRVGAGANEEADDFFAGVGFGYRW